MNKKVSIIVPVYNAEKYLPECLDSLINQTLKEIEIIIINDGSTDYSKEIILDHASKDNRITCIDSLNEGVSAARNKGLQHAQGTYVGFVDADDYLDNTMYEKLYESAEERKASLAVCNAWVVTDRGEPVKRLQLENQEIAVADKPVLIRDFLTFKYDFANWNKIYALDIIRQYQLKFDQKLAIWEDLLFNLTFLAYAKKMVTLSEPFYYYRLHTTSVIARSDLVLSKQYNAMFDGYVTFCTKNGLQVEKEVFMEERARNCIADLFALLKLRMRSRLKFFPLYQQFGTELRNLNPDIYTKSPQKLNLRFSWLLKFKLYKLFAFLYVSNYLVKSNIQRI